MKYLICVFLTLCMSCQTNKSQNDIFVEDNNVRNGNSLILFPPMKHGADNFVNIVDSTWFVPLYTNDSILISRISDIKFFSNNIFIADYDQGCIFKFDSIGSFVGRIDDLGEGPNQYKRLCSFDIDTINGKIYVLDGDLGKIFIYDFKLNQEKIVKLPFMGVDHISLLGNKYLLLELGFRFFEKGTTSSNLVLYNLKEDFVENKFFKYYNDKVKYHSRNTVAFSKSNDSLFYWKSLGHSIYYCTDSMMIETINYNLGKYSVPSSIYECNISDAQKNILENDLAFVDRFYDLDCWYYSRISRMRSAAHYFYNKVNSIGYIDLSFLKGNSKNIIVPDLYRFTGNILCGSLSPENYALLMKDLDFDIESNPVLVFYKLK